MTEQQIKLPRVSIAGLGLAVALCAQAGGAIWWASSISARVAALESAQAQTNKSLAALAAVPDQLDDLDENVAAVRALLDQLLLQGQRK